MPRSSSAWLGAEAVWITTAGWAAAAKRKFGDSMVVSIDRIASPEEAVTYPLIPIEGKVPQNRKPGIRFLPTFIRIFFNDILAWKNHRNWDIFEELDHKDGKVAFVWEKHDLFGGKGEKLARRLKVPYISYVHAPVVWEASKWGVKRYIWGRYLEKKESEGLKQADLVAVVSEEVRRKVLQMGIPDNKILISPMAVDPSLFKVAESEKEELRARYSLRNKFVIGWTGSFRKFHGLDHVIEAFYMISQKFPEAVLMLIGDGAEKAASEKLVAQLEIREKVIFVGKKPFLEVPKYLGLFDVAIVSARESKDFHYSPLKLREYLVSGIAVLAPDAGEVSALFETGYPIKLFRPGDIKSLFNGLEYFIENKENRQKIAAQGKEFALATNTWDCELEKALKRLNMINNDEKRIGNCR